MPTIRLTAPLQTPWTHAELPLHGFDSEGNPVREEDGVTVLYQQFNVGDEVTVSDTTAENLVLSGQAEIV